MRPDERETKIMTNNEKVCDTLRSVRAVDGKLKCDLEWPNFYPPRDRLQYLGKRSPGGEKLGIAS